MKSWASLETKINYLQRNLSRQLKQEPAFPLLLHFNYNDVIRPRGDILLKKDIDTFCLKKAFCGSDEEFCKEWNVDPNELKQAIFKRRGQREEGEELDILWAYAHADERYVAPEDQEVID